MVNNVTKEIFLSNFISLHKKSNIKKNNIIKKTTFIYPHNEQNYVS